MPLSCEQAFFHILVFLQVGNIAVSINGMEKSVSCQSGRLRTWYLALPPLPTRLFWSMGKGCSCVSIRYGAAVLSGNIFLGVQDLHYCRDTGCAAPWESGTGFPCQGGLSNNPLSVQVILRGIRRGKKFLDNRKNPVFPFNGWSYSYV